MRRKFRFGGAGVAVAAALAIGGAPGLTLGSTEPGLTAGQTLSQLYTLNFSTYGSGGQDTLPGSSSYSSPGVIYSPGFALQDFYYWDSNGTSNTSYNRMYVNSSGNEVFATGAYGPGVAAGNYEIAYNSTSGGYEATQMVAVAPPAVGSTLATGGTFSGNAMWLVDSAYQPGHEPTLNTANATGVQANGVTNDPAPGIMIQSTPVSIPVVSGQTTTKSFYVSFDAYVPINTGLSTGLFVGLSAQNNTNGDGLASISGTQGYSDQLKIPTGAWNLVQILINASTTGGSTNTGSAGEQIYLNGTLVGSLAQRAFNSTYMTGTAVNLLPIFGLERGGQGSAPEAYITDITASQVVPEPATLGLMVVAGAGILLVGRRRTRA